MNFSIIAAVSETSCGIGHNNKLPWGMIVGDMIRFRKMTENTVVIMGRNTWESLPKKPLKNRVNIVLSRRLQALHSKSDTGLLLQRNTEEKLDNDSPYILPSFEEALQFASTFKLPIFVIGGSDVYYKSIYMNECKMLYLTIIREENFEATFDAFFPRIPDEYDIFEETDNISEDKYTYKFVTYQRARDSNVDQNYCFICGNEIKIESQLCGPCARKL